MALTIIEKNTPPNDKLWTGSCRHCNSKAECFRSDLKNITIDPRCGDEFSWESCPVCGAGADSGYGGLLMYPKV